MNKAQKKAARRQLMIKQAKQGGARKKKIRDRANAERKHASGVIKQMKDRRNEFGLFSRERRHANEVIKNVETTLKDQRKARREKSATGRTGLAVKKRNKRKSK